MAGKTLRAVVIGATTLLGKELLEEINGSAAVAWDLQLLEEEEDAAGRLTAAGDEALVTQPLTREAFAGADLVFFAGDRATAKEYWQAAVKASAAVVDMTGALEGEPGFAVRSPWVQGGQRPDLTTLGVIPAQPAAVMLAVTAERLQRRLGQVRVTATVLEPASQAGSAGVDELHQQTVGLLSFQEVPKEIFGTQVAFNLQTERGEEAQVQLAAVKRTLREHLHLLLGPAAGGEVSLSLVQAPVFHGYTISAAVELAAPATAEQVRRALHGGVIQAELDTAVSNQAATEIGDVLLQVEEGTGAAAQHWVWMAADNLRLSARNALACAFELAGLRPSASVQ